MPESLGEGPGSRVSPASHVPLHGEAAELLGGRSQNSAPASPVKKLVLKWHHLGHKSLSKSFEAAGCNPFLLLSDVQTPKAGSGLLQRTTRACSQGPSKGSQEASLLCHV